MSTLSSIQTALQNANRVAVLTGAGISAESGIPTFRGDGGLWKNFRAEDLATPQAFAKNPGLVWEWYEWRKGICAKAIPNPAHITLAQWEKRIPEFHIFTQNVDGLHKRAGSVQLTCIHGEIFSARCTKCIYKNKDTPVVWEVIPPHCPECNGLLRPDIVWFGESYDLNQLKFAFEYVEKADVFLVIGTSGSVGVPVQLAEHAKQFGSLTIEINPEPSSYHSFMEIVIKEKAGTFLPTIQF